MKRRDSKMEKMCHCTVDDLSDSSNDEEDKNPDDEEWYKKTDW
jgi:hypothetical protein